MIGKMLGNRYEIVEQIGSGGMAYVYKAKCHLLDRFVAIKILKEEFTDDEDFIRKFRRESQAAASLSHPNILNIYDVGSEEQDNKKIHYIVMEYIKGKTLKELIVGNEKLQIDQSLYYATQIAEALSNAHKNHIVHRDIKPHNIMVTEDNRVKVTDFGIARAVTSSTITTTSSVLGSVHYFSPEQARGGYTDEKSDIYSLGIVMYEMITGKVPFNGDTPIGVALKHVQEDIVPPVDASSDIPREVNDIIMKCVMKRQGDRYQSADELLRDLKAYIDTRTIPENQTTEETSDMTRVIPVVSAERESSRSQTMDRSKKNKRNRNNKNKSVVIISAILAAFILATLIFAGYMRLRDNISTSDDILMPSLIGMTQEDAEVIAKDEGFQLNVVNSVSSTEYEAGRIISQNVDEGVRVKPGYPVSVTISLGSDRVTVPLLVNRTLTEAETIIKEAGMRMNVEYDFSDTVPIDVVMEQSIESFTEVEPNTRIDLIVSKGEEISDVIMIQLIGTQISQAMNDIVGLDLVVGEVTYEPNNDVPANVVTWQSYDAGTTLETKTAVDMYVSSGPEPEPEPDPVEEPEPPSSDEESSFTFTLTPFTDREETEITIFRKQGGDATMVYSETHQADDGSFQVTVNGVPGAQFEVYYDGIYQFTRVKEG
ncbi:Stk1 family PASTA domain-containing Ser/Thr kinase [Gudongella sp. DL1XJH-153]|uniref:Stk1 family PASTA domain-containing Ser/Thr kinase n=1 Tax=Gudongella sp. DL1XJH-153 TaxID=3409804 RepID=UPI003BB721CA